MANHSLWVVILPVVKLPRPRRFFWKYQKHVRNTSGIYRSAFGEIPVQEDLGSARSLW